MRKNDIEVDVNAVIGFDIGFDFEVDVEVDNEFGIEFDTMFKTILNENGEIIITDGELNSEKISGFGEIILNNSAYLNLTDIYPIFEGVSVNFNSNESWIRFYNLDPSSAFYYYHDNIFYDDQQLSYPENMIISKWGQ